MTLPAERALVWRAFLSGSRQIKKEKKVKIDARQSTQKLAISGVVMAAYIVVMYVTQSFAFGQYQIRIATAIYGLAYLFPFLTVPLGLANLLSNMLMGGLGIFDIVGGGLVGILTAGSCALIGKKKLSPLLVFFPITLIPALGVSTWLSGILNVPYFTLALSLLVGQAVAGAVGTILVKALTYSVEVKY